MGTFTSPMVSFSILYSIFCFFLAAFHVFGGVKVGDFVLKAGDFGAWAR